MIPDHQYAAGVLFQIAEVLHDAVEKKQEVEVSWSAPVYMNGSVLGNDGRLWATHERTGEFEVLLKIGPFPPAPASDCPA